MRLLHESTALRPAHIAKSRPAPAVQAIADAPCCPTAAALAQDIYQLLRQGMPDATASGACALFPVSVHAADADPRPRWGGRRAALCSLGQRQSCHPAASPTCERRTPSPAPAAITSVCSSNGTSASDFASQVITAVVSVAGGVTALPLRCRRAQPHFAPARHKPHLCDQQRHASASLLCRGTAWSFPTPRCLPTS